MCSSPFERPVEVGREGSGWPPSSGRFNRFAAGAAPPKPFRLTREGPAGRSPQEQKEPRLGLGTAPHKRDLQRVAVPSFFSLYVLCLKRSSSFKTNIFVDRAECGCSRVVKRANEELLCRGSSIESRSGAVDFGPWINSAIWTPCLLKCRSCLEAWCAIGSGGICRRKTFAASACSCWFPMRRGRRRCRCCSTRYGIKSRGRLPSWTC